MSSQGMKLALCVLLLSGRATSIIWPWSSDSEKQSNSTCASINGVYECIGKNLTKIPDLPISVQSVTLDDNLIKRVELNLDLVKLQNLSLRGNLIDRLDSQPFMVAGKKLVNLYLSFNRISEISPLYFGTLDKLENLFLGNNRLTALADGTFSRVVLPSLKQLDLRSNNLSSFEPAVLGEASPLLRLRLRNNVLTRFDGFQMAALSHLDLGLNRITQLSNNTFAGLPNLLYLDVSGNGLTDLGTSLQNLSRLAYLYLNNNRISRIKASWFLGTAIQSLYLSGNPLTVVDKPIVPRQVGPSVLQVTICNSATLSRIKTRAFSYMNNLRTLVVCNNERLVRVDDGLLDSVAVPSNLTLILNNNSLTTLATDALDVAQYKIVDLTENPWLCDCRIQWLANQCNLRNDSCKPSNFSLACTNINSDLVSLNGSSCDDDPNAVKNSRGSRFARSRTLSAVGIAIFAVCLSILLGLFVWWYCFKRKGRKCACVYTSSWGTKGTTSGYRYSEVQKATNASIENEQATDVIPPADKVDV